MNDDFLTKFRKTPRPEFAASLYQRINKPMQTKTRPQIMRFATLALPLLILTMTVFLLSPSARAFAQDLIRQVGGYLIMQGSADEDTKTSWDSPACPPKSLPEACSSIDENTKTPKDIGIERTKDSVVIKTTKDIPVANGPAEASSLAGFTILAPTYLPEGYTSMTGWFVTSQDNEVVVTTAYKDKTNNFLAINQLKFSEGAPQQTFHRDSIVDVMVRGQGGVWLPNADPAAPDGKNALLWEENGITYSIVSNALSLDQSLEVAESLGG